MELDDMGKRELARWKELRERFNDRYGRFKVRGYEIHIVTGGWSDNEEVTGEILHDLWLSRRWKSSHRGGLHVFDCDDNEDSTWIEILKAIQAWER